FNCGRYRSYCACQSMFLTLKLNENSTEEDLYNTLVEMMDLLDDGHVSLFTGQEALPFFGSGPAFKLFEAGLLDFIDTDVIKSYLEEEIAAIEDDEIIHGLLPDNIGYIYIGSMFENLAFWEEVMDGIMDDLKDTRAIILDLRNNGGGEDEAGRLITSYFTDSEAMYMKVRYKNGPNPNDFEAVREWSIAPSKGTPYTNPLVMLTDRYTISAGETFGLALKTLPQMIHVGDTTNAAFSDTVQRELPNRWRYSIPVAEVTDQNDISWEGIGLIPDVVIRNDVADLSNGIDEMLEKAIEVLQ
ncbi:MAG: S41 family peptidase, partial [Bacteroidota bacterium]